MSDRLVQDPISPSTAEGYELLRGGCGRYELKNSALFELTGEDRKAWLQGQITNDMRNLQPGGSMAFCLCSPTGQTEAVGDLWSVDDRYLIRMHRAASSAFQHRLDHMIIMEDVVARDLTPAYRLVCLQGPYATAQLREHLELPHLDASVSQFKGVEVICLRSNRTGLGGWDLLVPNEAEEAWKALESAFAPIDERAFNIARLEAGIPRFGEDIDARVLPPELGPWFESKHVSYQKGCYTGQEVLMRIHSRGHTNRTWMALISDQPMAVGDRVAHRDREDAGTITSAEFSPQFGFIAGAMIRREAAFDGEVVTVQTQDGSVEAEVREFPLLDLS
jgi:folate-binding protein YgfZ